MQVGGVLGGSSHLTAVFHCIEGTAGQGSVAAHLAGLFNDDDGLAFLVGGDSSSHTGAAGTNNNHISGHFLVLLLLYHRSDGLEGLHIAAGLGHTIGHAVQNGVGGEGSTGHCINAQALELDDLGRHALADGNTDAGGLLMLQLNVGDGSVAEGNGNGHLPHTHCYRAIGSGIVQPIAGHRLSCLFAQQEHHCHNGQYKDQRDNEIRAPFQGLFHGLILSLRFFPS